ncbi:MAG: allantoicase [Thermoanaerobaculia bacterium]
MPAFADLVDLASERLGGAVLAANDEFFAPTENLLKASRPVLREDEYTDRGKWMDGWETRRRRTPGHDWCLIRLGLPGVLRGVVVDTSHFKGNYPDSCSLEACEAPGGPSPEELQSAAWTAVLPKSPLRGDCENAFEVTGARRATHVRFNIFPDGGVARLRVYGVVAPDREKLSRPGEIDLAAVEHGGLVVAASDMFFGNRHNLILPGPARGMHDGWETRRRRGPGHDWAIVKLAGEGIVRRVEVDTTHFKGNAPESCSVEGLAAPEASAETLADPAAPWREILPRTPLTAHTVHTFEREIRGTGPVTHARLNIYPDGGVARLRLFGSLALNPA